MKPLISKVWNFAGLFTGLYVIGDSLTMLATGTSTSPIITTFWVPVAVMVASRSMKSLEESVAEGGTE